jgi:hypothetical protein
MSKFVRVQTELRDVSLVKRSLDELKLVWRADQTYKHRYSGASQQAALVVDAPGAYFGLRSSADGPLEVMGDDMQMVEVRRVLGRVTQRYAYHRVIEETGNAGFVLVDETTGKDGVIRMTVRKWG